MRHRINHKIRTLKRAVFATINASACSIFCGLLNDEYLPFALASGLTVLYIGQ